MNQDQRFELNKITAKPGWWICIDKKNSVACSFKQHEYNETGEIKIINKSNLIEVNELALIAEEMSIWIHHYHYNTAKPKIPVYFWETRDILVRNKFPEWKLFLQEEVNKEELASSLKDAVEWLQMPENTDYELKHGKDNTSILISNEFPKWKLYFQKEVEDVTLRSNLKKTAEWLLKSKDAKMLN